MGGAAGRVPHRVGVHDVAPVAAQSGAHGTGAAQLGAVVAERDRDLVGRERQVLGARGPRPGVEAPGGRGQ